MNNKILYLIAGYAEKVPMYKQSIVLAGGLVCNPQDIDLKKKRNGDVVVAVSTTSKKNVTIIIEKKYYKSWIRIRKTRIDKTKLFYEKLDSITRGTIRVRSLSNRDGEGSIYLFIGVTKDL